MLAALLPVCDALIVTSSQNPRASATSDAQSLARQLGGPPPRSCPTRTARWRAPARSPGPDGVVIATGSIYLIADLLAAGRPDRASIL